jgi:hypothetical protein
MRIRAVFGQLHHFGAAGFFEVVEKNGSPTCTICEPLDLSFVSRSGSKSLLPASLEFAVVPKRLLGPFRTSQQDKATRLPARQRLRAEMKHY